MTTAPGRVGAAGGRTRVFLVDDHEMVARGLAAVLEREDDLHVVGTAASADECLRSAPASVPDVVVMDLRLGDADGLQTTRDLRAVLPETNVVILTAYADQWVMARALEAGCCGFLSKTARPEELIAAVRAAANGSTTFPRDAVERLVRHDEAGERAGLSARELEVLRLMAAGHSTNDIAATLNLSVHTTRNHVRNLMSKLDVHSRLDAVVTAARAGLIVLPDDA
jgi:DNA-binding NarL/FixJ family response regulator